MKFKFSEAEQAGLNLILSELNHEDRFSCVTAHLESWNDIEIVFIYLSQFLGVVSLASVILIVEVKLQIPWRRRLWQLIILMFVISVPWTWYELLKVNKNIP